MKGRFTIKADTRNFKRGMRKIRFQLFLLKIRVWFRDTLFTWLWTDIYRIGTIGSARFIIRNQWHEWSSCGTYLLEIGKTKHRDRKEFVLTILGFQLVGFFE